MVAQVLPGRRERHLLRRRDNPLFPPDRREVGAGELAAARAADAAEAQAFARDLTALLEKASHLTGQVESDVILGLKEEADRLYEQCRGLGDGHQPQEQGLQRLLEVLMAAVRQGAGNDPQALDELAQEEAARAMHQRLLQAPLIADLLHPESPIRDDELVPTLLSAEPETFTAALGLFEPEQVAEILSTGRDLVAGLAEGSPERARGERLLALGRSQGAGIH
jgi:hypothetical protein